MSKQYIIDANGLHKRFYGKLVVDDVSLQVKEGEIYGFLGPNGSGKTTTIRMLCGLIQPDSGRGRCLNYDILKQAEFIKPLVGYVPQSFCLYKDLTVSENLKFIARTGNGTGYISSVTNIISELELTSYKNTLAGNLSGGWKQRLSLAAALIHEPKLLLLDEPTAGLDPKARQEFWHYISQLTQRGVTVLVSTHYMDEAERCNRLAYVVRGRLMIEGTIPDIIRQVGLTTWLARGSNFSKLSDELHNKSWIEQVTPWGNILRICGNDPIQMQNTISEHPDFSWEMVSTSLEEVFVYLVHKRNEIKSLETLNDNF